MDCGGVIDVLLSEIEYRGSARNWARRAAVSEQYVSDVVAGRRAPGAKILKALGIEATIQYTQVYCRRCGDGKLADGYRICQWCLDHDEWGRGR